MDKFRISSHLYINSNVSKLNERLLCRLTFTSLFKFGNLDHKVHMNINYSYLTAMNENEISINIVFMSHGAGKNTNHTCVFYQKCVYLDGSTFRHSSRITVVHFKLTHLSTIYKSCNNDTNGIKMLET